jgi:hypothetical protein
MLTWLSEHGPFAPIFMPLGDETADSPIADALLTRNGCGGEVQAFCH